MELALNHLDYRGVEALPSRGQLPEPTKAMRLTLGVEDLDQILPEPLAISHGNPLEHGCDKVPSMRRELVG